MSITNGDRKSIIDFLKQKRSESKFTVIDVGGSVTGWSSSVIDALIDFNDPENKNSSIKHFKVDITHSDSWKEILEYVTIHGKFDFSICSHTLEDIINPGFVCEMLQKISNAGYIAVPSIHYEMARHEGNWRGFIHHRWFFIVENDIFTACPKINCIEQMNLNEVESRDSNKADLSFLWNTTIRFKYLNNNYLGPSMVHVIRMYNDVFERNKLRPTG